MPEYAPFELPYEGPGAVRYRALGGERKPSVAPTANKQVLAFTTYQPPVLAPVTLDNTYLADRTRSIEVSGSRFAVVAGGQLYAARGSNLRYTAWDLDAAATEALSCDTVLIPGDYTSGALTVFIHWVNLGAGAGNVVWRIAAKEVGAADLNTTSGETSTDTTATAGTQDVKVVTTHGISLTPSAAFVHYRFNVARIGGDAADTLANDAGFIKLQISYVADS